MEISGSSVILNGEEVSRETAKISVFDRGFIFGDSIYEVIPIYNKEPFCLDRHLNRMLSNLNKTGIKNPLNLDSWTKLIQEFVKKQSINNQKLYIQISRGVATRQHRIPENIDPTYLMFTDELVVLSDTEFSKGIKCVTMEDFRWLRGDIKSTSLLAAVLSTELAYQNNASEVIFHRDNKVSEGASSNILLVINDALVSPILDNRILNGITLSVISDIANEMGTPIEYRDISLNELFEASEVMIVSSGREIVPVTNIDQKIVNEGMVGKISKVLWKKFRKLTNV